MKEPTADRGPDPDIPGGVAGRMKRMLRVHWAFAALVGIALTLRIIVTISYRPALFFTGDSVVYLNNAADLSPGEARPAGYAFFLKALLPLQELLLVPVTQHLLGVAVGVALYALMIRLGLNRTLAAFASVLILFDPLQLVIEQHILSETLFQALLVTALLLLLWRPTPSVAVCGALGGALATAAVTRTIGVVLLIPILLYAAVSKFGWWRIGAIAGFFAVPVLAYAFWFQAENGRFNLSNYSGRFLYGRVAPFADCEHTPIASVAQKALCPPGRPSVRNPWPTWWVFGPPSPLGQPPLAGSKEIDQQAREFALRTIRQQPLSYATAVAGDFLDYFRFFRATDTNDDPVEVDFPFRTDTLTAYPVPEIDNWIRRAEGSDSARGVVVRPLASALNRWAHYFYIPGPLIGLALILGVVGAFLRPPGGKRDLRGASGLFTVSAFLLLIIPVATVVFDYRHMVPAFPLIGPAAAIGAGAVWARLRGRA